jgi:FAD/FMN-containing dehydrogenase/Fe-S oxidoreductase
MHAIDTDRLRDDLAGLLEGELLLDELSRSLYATDASPFEVLPLGVLRPKHESDVQTVVRYAAEHAIPLIARGAGTGTAGSAIGPGLVIDFSRYLNAVRDTGPDWVRLQPGVTWAELDRALAGEGRRLGFEPADTPTSTVGGIVAASAAGARLAQFGYPHDHLVSCRCVLDTGDAVEVGRVPRIPGGDLPDRFRRLHRAAIELLDRHAATIAAEGMRGPLDRCGYRLDALTDDYFDYPRLLSGSEGTLALITELTVRTQPRPGGRGVALFGFANLDIALRASLRVLPRRPTACTLLDRRLLSLVRARSEPFGKVIPAETGAAVAVEMEADSQAEARRWVLDLVDELSPANGWAHWALPAVTTDDAERLWGIVEAATPSLADLRGGPSAVMGVEDVGVPPEQLAEFLPRLQDILQSHEATAAFLVHVAAGAVQARPFLDLAQPADAARLWAIAEDVYAAALAVGGTISVRQGTGLARTPWVAKQFPRRMAVFRELKTIFDPRHLLNPGNIVGPNPARPAWPMRSPLARHSAGGDEAGALQSQKAAKPRSPLGAEELLIWRPDDFHGQIAACNGCGACRADGPPQRMCPIFRAGRAEEATPRAKANLLRELLRPGGEARRPNAAAVRAVADLCVNCKMCAHECPSHVNIPKLMLEAKAAHVEVHGLDRADWVMARLNMFSGLGSMFALLANRLLRGPFTRWFMEKFFGVSRRRRLPPFASRSFLRQAKRLGWTHKPGVRGQGSEVRESNSNGLAGTPDPRSPTPGVALFVDIFANYHDPSVAEAAYRVLQHVGVPVIVPPEQTSCGMEALAQGDLDTARDLARQNLRAFANLVREGWMIVCTEPTSALALTHDYLDLIDDADAQLLASHTVELTSFLADCHARGQLPTDFQPLNLALGHHVPCHLKALGGAPAAPALLRLIPGLRVAEIDVGCSGMAGTFGLRAEHYETSLAAGRSMFTALRRPGIQFGTTECSSCRLQMEEGTEKRTLHPVQYLALAYGLMPELEQRLLAPVGGLVVE